MCCSPGFQRQQFRQTNTTLEVRKIPPEFNNIAKLNEHFGKFGNLTNIQVRSSLTIDRAYIGVHG